MSEALDIVHSMIKHRIPHWSSWQMIHFDLWSITHTSALCISLINNPSTPPGALSRTCGPRCIIRLRNICSTFGLSSTECVGTSKRSEDCDLAIRPGVGQILFSLWTWISGGSEIVLNLLMQFYLLLSEISEAYDSYWAALLLYWEVTLCNGQCRIDSFLYFSK